MILVLSIVVCPHGVAPESLRTEAGTLSIGRGAANDWVLADPDRVLSKRHCVIARCQEGSGEAWRVTDISANGTFLNHDPEPLGADASRILRGGDRLRLGSYEIDVQIERPAEPAVAAGFYAGFSQAAASVEDRLTSDPFRGHEHDDPLGIAMPQDDLPVGFGPALPDRTPAISEHFRAPQASLQQLPEDWDIEAAAAPAPPAPPVPLAFLLEDRTPENPVRIPQQPGTAFAAFAAGAGIGGPAPADPDAVLRSLGGAFRAVVSGLRSTMMARAAIKGEFRIDQTTIQAAGNNPLKFSADDDDALAALLGIGRSTGMTAERAVREAMRDIRLHELAMASAMQSAVRDLLRQLDLAQVEHRAGSRLLDLLPGQRQRRLWNASQALHREITRGLGDDFDRVFGKSFMHAYECAMRELMASGTGTLAGEQRGKGD